MIEALQFLPAAPDASLIYVGSYDPVWVVISILLAILASYAALNASSRVENLHDTQSKLIWTLIGAFTLGIGIWAMHFIGMLALNLPCGIYYEPVITLISMIPGILASGVALGVVWHDGTKRLSPLIGSVLLGAGIGTMHYTGMAAMRLDGFVRYDPSLFALSIVVAVALSYLALRVKSGFAPWRIRSNLLVAIIMGSAVSGMHYTAMSAAYFVRGDVATLPSSIFTTNSLAILIALTTIFLALAALALAAFSRNREITDKLRESEKRWEFALEGAGDGVWDWNLKTDKALYSKRWKDMVGYAENEFPDTRTAWVEHLHPDDKDRVLSVVQDYSAGILPLYVVEFRMRCKDGSWKWILARGMLVSRDAYGNPLRMIGTHTDISDRKRVEADLRIASVAFETQEGIMITDAQGVILRVNQVFCETTGYTAEEVVGQTPRLLKSGRHNEDFYRDMWETINRTGTWQGEIWDRRKNGEVYPKWLTISAVKGDDGSITHYVGSHIDITERKAAEDKINHLAFYDRLTRLPNRRLLMDRLQHAMASSTRNGKEGALLFIDLDNFKTLNDSLGHDIGDLQLQQVAQRLKSCTRESDTVARLGGDEFVVMLENLSEKSNEAAAQTEVVGEKILAALNQPYQLATHEYHGTTSIGATLFNGNPSSIEELMKQADIAMYQAKRAGRNALRFFDPQMQANISARASLENELHKALENQEFHLHYQIQMDNSFCPLGAEALIRWIHPERGMVSPAQFIPLAEETGLILPIGQWVLETACAQIKAWQQYALTRDLILAVNVSAIQFRQADFVAHVQAAIQRHVIKPTLLKLELTEGMLLENIEDTIATMNTLKAFGVQFSLDDFGTGYSSLQYLKRLPLDQLKIDQSFVRNIITDSGDKAIVRTIIAMARSLDMDVIAEGVETQEQRQYLLGIGCHHYQGYLFGRPVPIEQFEALLEQG